MIRNRTTRVERRRGSALFASLIVVMVVASLGAGLIQMHGAISRRQLQSIDTKRALYMAEAGLSEALLAITHGKSGNVGTADEPAAFGDGVFWTEAVEEGDDRVAVVSHGLCGSGRFSLSMVLQRNISEIAALGAFGQAGITVDKGAIVDGYDSTLGTYASQIDGSLATPSTGTSGRLS